MIFWTAQEESRVPTMKFDFYKYWYYKIIRDKEPKEIRT